MKPEYSKLIERVLQVNGWSDAETYKHLVEVVCDVVAACEALAKPRELTNAELFECFETYQRGGLWANSMQAAIAKADEIRARPAGEYVPFDYDKWRDGGWQAQYQIEDFVRGVTRWVDADYVVQHQTLRMRKI